MQRGSRVGLLLRGEGRTGRGTEVEERTEKAQVGWYELFSRQKGKGNCSKL